METIALPIQSLQESNELSSKSLKRVSFRDPSGTVFVNATNVLRRVSAHLVPNVQSVLKLKSLGELVQKQQFISSKQVGETEFEHPKIFFVSYPYEWCPAMLYEAGCLTLQVFEKLLSDGYGLKDANSRNVLFNSTSPLFVDLLSVEKRHPNDATWLAFEQFLRHFVYPLALVHSKRDTVRSYFLSSSDGASPQEVAGKLGLKAYFPRYFSLIAIPGLLAKLAHRRQWQQRPSQKYVSSPECANFILKILVKHLQRGLERVKPTNIPQSRWSNYGTGAHPYPEVALKEKLRVVARVLAMTSPHSVLDLGANTGTYSLLAARSGASVVSVDSDPSCVALLWDQAKINRLNILGLCMDISEPSPGLGWNNAETLSFKERVEKKFDLTLGLALLHHLLVKSLPLEEVLAFVAHTTQKYALIEFADESDSQVRGELAARGNTIQYPSKTEFVQVCNKYFEIVESFPIPSMNRSLYLLKVCSI